MGCSYRNMQFPAAAALIKLYLEISTIWEIYENRRNHLKNVKLY